MLFSRKSATRIKITFCCYSVSRLMCLTAFPCRDWTTRQLGFTQVMHLNHINPCSVQSKSSISGIHYHRDYFASSEVWFWLLFPGAQPWLVWEEWGSRNFGPKVSLALSALSAVPTSSLVDPYGHQWPRLHLASAIATTPCMAPLESSPLAWYLPKPNLHFVHSPSDHVFALWFPPPLAFQVSCIYSQTPDASYIISYYIN